MKKNKRLTIKELFFEENFKKKIIEVNLFSEISKDNVKDFNNYFSLNVELFDEKDKINKFRLTELSEYSYYLVCKECYNSPVIELKDDETILITCSKCKIKNEIEKIENIVNYSSKFVSNAIQFCNLHKEKIPSNIYCKTHNLFLCQDCFDNHQKEVPIGNDIIKVIFSSIIQTEIFFHISKKTPINELLKMYINNIGIPQNLMDEPIYFLFKGDKIDFESQKTLEQFGVDDGAIILAMPNEDNDLLFNRFSLEESFWNKNHNFIRLNKLKKNICIFHNKDLILNCIQCDMKICNECKNNHNNHSIEKIDNKNIFLKEDYMEYENFIINNENKKKRF